MFLVVHIQEHQHVVMEAGIVNLFHIQVVVSLFQTNHVADVQVEQ